MENVPRDTSNDLAQKKGKASQYFSNDRIHNSTAYSVLGFGEALAS